MESMFGSVCKKLCMAFLESLTSATVFIWNEIMCVCLKWERHNNVLGGVCNKIKWDTFWGREFSVRRLMEFILCLFGLLVEMSCPQVKIV